MITTRPHPHLAEWDALGGTPDERIDLLSAAMLVARDEYPALDLRHYETLLDTHAEAIGKHLPENADTQQRLMALSRYLFEEVGFAGNHDAFYDPRNSYLNEVLDRRLGIPLSLALVQMELARRLGRAHLYVFRADGENEAFYRALGFAACGRWAQARRKGETP